MQKVIYPEAEAPKSENEQFYERDVALIVGKITELCRARGIAFIAACEYDPDAAGVVGWIPDQPSPAMAMLAKLLNAGDNFDAFAQDIVTWMREQGIDYSASPAMMALSALFPAAAPADSTTH